MNKRHLRWLLGVGFLSLLTAFSVVRLYDMSASRADAAAVHSLIAATETAAMLGNGPTVPAGVILIWPGTNGSIPAGFVRETALDGLFPKGTLTSPDVTGGAATHTHTSPAHSHTVAASHTHTGQSSSNTQEEGDPKTDSNGSELHNANHFHSYSISAISSSSSSSVAVTYSAVSNNPPYTEVIFLRSLGTASVPPGAVALFGDVDIPSGFQSCDGTGGTLNLLNRYPRGASAGGDSGATGGSTTNAHTIAHTHTVSHAHFGNSGGPSARNTPGQQGCCGPNMANANHVHPVTLNNVDLTSGSNSAIGAQAETVEPAYRKLLAIQNTSVSGEMPRGIIGLWLGDPGSLPGGWALCDGQGGRPDMSDRFLKVAASTGEIGAAGGNHTHTHAAQSHDHSLPSHSHSGSVGQSGNTDATKGRLGGTLHRYWTNVASNPHSLASCSSVAGATNSASTTADAASNEPAYRTVAFIQYVNTPPTDPTNPSPPDGAYTSDNTPLCDWDPSTDVEENPITYYFTLSAESDLSSPIVDNVDLGTNTEYQNGALADGVYYWQVLVWDGASYNNSSPIWSFTLDTQNPGDLLIRGMQCDFDNQTITRLFGTGEDGTSLAFFTDGDAPVPGSATWDGGGNFTFTPTTAMANGSSVYASATDAASNVTWSRTRVNTFDSALDVFRDMTTVHAPGGSSIRLERDTQYQFKIAVNGGTAVTVTAWLRHNGAYSGAAPSISITGLGINGTGPATDAMAGPADAWEQLSVTGSPNADGVLTLTIETFSTADSSATWVDDIAVSQ